MNLLLKTRHAWGKLKGQPLLPPGIVIGRGVFLGRGVRLDWSHGRHIVIEDGATIADGARLLCHDASSYRRLGITWVAPVCVRARAFIGVDAIVLPGVTIGEDAVVAAGSVVTHDVSRGTVVAGNPAVDVGSTSALDSRRLDELSRVSVFDESRYNGRVLDEPAAKRLDEAVAEHGGYFLAQSHRATNAGSADPSAEPDAGSRT
jgi:hypothetical protein